MPLLHIKPVLRIQRLQKQFLGWHTPVMYFLNKHECKESNTFTGAEREEVMDLKLWEVMFNIIQGRGGFTMKLVKLKL